MFTDFQTNFIFRAIDLQSYVIDYGDSEYMFKKLHGITKAKARKELKKLREDIS